MVNDGAPKPHDYSRRGLAICGESMAEVMGEAFGARGCWVRRNPDDPKAWEATNPHGLSVVVPEEFDGVEVRVSGVRLIVQESGRAGVLDILATLATARVWA